MKTEDEERYVFFRFCISDLQECRDTLDLLIEVENDALRLAVIKSAIVSYARPFSGNEGKYRSKGKWRLDKNLVPLNYGAIHTKAMEYRDRFVAHSDIPYRAPELLKAPRGYAIGSNRPELHELIDLSKPLRETCVEIIRALWVEVRKYDEKPL